MPRPPIDLHQKVRDLLRHTDALPAELSSPIVNFERIVDGYLALLKYVDEHLRTSRIYKAVYNRHMVQQRRMALGSLIEAFERFLKELAVVCVDHVAPNVYDDRFEEFKPSGTELAAHFAAGTVGKAMCEAGTWISNGLINDRFRRLLKAPFGDPWEFLFPNEKQRPASERERARTLAILWQVRHTITHNVGVLTESDSSKLRFLAKEQIAAGTLLAPTKEDLRYVKRFLFETARHTNERIGQRLAELLTEIQQSDAGLFDAQRKAHEISYQFGLVLAVHGKVGNP